MSADRERAKGKPARAKGKPATPKAKAPKDERARAKDKRAKKGKAQKPDRPQVADERALVQDDGGQVDGAAEAKRTGAGDVLLGDLRRAGLLPLLVLRFVAEAPAYGNQLMERIGRLTAGTLSINPNTMYPLLRRLEARGLIAGEWEHPERRSRRFYRITAAGEAELARLRRIVGPRLEALATGVDALRDLLGR